MKICTICNQTFTDDNQNYCLNDGSVLSYVKDEPPPPVFMNSARPTDQTNWANTNPGNSWNNQPLQQQQAFPLAQVHGKNQTLPTVALVLGVLSLVLVCCYGGIPFGIAALITGFLGLSNSNKDPMSYGGRGLAIGGMILGAIGLFVSIIVFILAVIGNM